MTLSASALRSASPARLGCLAAGTIRRRLSTEVPQSESLLIADPLGLRVVDLNRPKALNALNGEMIATLLPLTATVAQAANATVTIETACVDCRRFPYQDYPTCYAHRVENRP